MSFASDMQDLKALENKIQSLVQKLCDDLLDMVGDEQSIGLVSESPAIAIVPLSKLSSRSWSPEYYIPSCQVNAVKSRLEGAKGIDGVCKAVREMITSKKVEARNQKSILLNEDTVRALENSELGKYAMSIS